MKKSTKLITLLLLLFALIAMPVNAAALPADEEGKVNLYFFYSPTCPHCQAEHPFLQEMEQKYPALKVHYIEAAKNEELFSNASQAYLTTTSGVPRTYLADIAFIGYSEEPGNFEYNKPYKAYIGYKNQIEKTIADAVSNKPVNNTGSGNNNLVLPDAKKMPLWIFLLIPAYLLTLFIFFKKINNAPNVRKFWIAGLFFLIIICLFLFIALTPEQVIKAYAEKMPFPLFVFVIALADGFNPCSFTVLIILLSLLTYTKNKKDMFIFGSTFAAVSGIMYFIFIMVMIVAGSWILDRYGIVILRILGAIILGAALINIKDFFFFKKGVSLSMSEKDQTKITGKARKIIGKLNDAKNIWAYLAALGGTALLAVVVNMVELGCTAILPVVYMATLIGKYGEIIGLQHIFWTIIYSVIYILPLFAILLNFVYTFKSTRLSEKQGRILKLIAGLFMLFFGLLMALKPTVLFR